MTTDLDTVDVLWRAFSDRGTTPDPADPTTWTVDGRPLPDEDVAAVLAAGPGEWDGLAVLHAAQRASLEHLHAAILARLHAADGPGA